MASSVKYYRDDAALTILGNLTEQNSENTQTLADVSVRLSTLEDSSNVSIMGSGNSYAAGLVLAGDAIHGSEFLRKDGTWAAATASGFAPLASPTFTGSPQAPTPATVTAEGASGDTSIVTTAYIQNYWAHKVGTAPPILNTIEKIAIAMGDDLNPTTSLVTTISTKPTLATGQSDTATGQVHSTKFLRGDGTWQTPTDTNTQLTQEQVEDYVNGLIVGGTNVTATYNDGAGTLTLDGAATNLAHTADGGSFVITSSTGNNVSLPAATTSAWGIMTDEDKSKLTGIAANANNYTLPTTVSTNSKVYAQIQLTENTFGRVGGAAADILVAAYFGGDPFLGHPEENRVELSASLNMNVRIANNHADYRGFIIPRNGTYNINWNVDLYGNGTNNRNMWVFCERNRGYSGDATSANSLSGGTIKQLAITTQWENDSNAHGHSMAGNWIGVLQTNDVIYFRGKMEKAWVARWYEGTSTNEENHTTNFNIFNID